MGIKVKDLFYTYNKGLPDETNAINGISFEMPDNSIMGIIGPTGSGKSTLLMLLSGLIKPDSGNIKLKGRAGIVFQYPEYQLFEETVLKDVAFGPTNLGIKGPRLTKLIKDSMALVGLDYDQLANKSPFDLSGGEKRRVAIAGILAMSPRLLILDEPTAGLDPKAKQSILKMIQKIHKQNQIDVILVSHNMDDIARLCDSILVLNQGNLMLQGSPGEVFADSNLLSQIGLSKPIIMQIMENLNARDAAFDPSIYDVPKAASHIAKTIHRRTSCD